MKVLIKTVVLSLCVNFMVASETYRAASVTTKDNILPSAYPHLIREAGLSNADILVLPAPDLSGVEDNYDEIVSAISRSAKQSGLYVVAHLFERGRCQDAVELLRSNLVFDRDGEVVSVYRKPVARATNCTTPDSALTPFSTDFGVSFASVMEEDLVLQEVRHFEGLKNFVVAGGVGSEGVFSGSQLILSWAYIAQANLISSRGVIAGQQGSRSDDGNLVLADLNKTGHLESKTSAPVVYPGASEKPSYEVMTQYTIRTLEVEPSIVEYKETVCHGGFCCDFNIKTDQEPNAGFYGLAVYAGVRRYSGVHHIGVQNCAIFPCAGVYSQYCKPRSQNITSTTFEKISVITNITQKNSIQYPIIQSTGAIPSNQFNFVSKTDSNPQVSLEAGKVQSFSVMGIFGRDYTKDYDTEVIVESKNGTESSFSFEIYDFLNSDDIMEFVDFVWIRLRVLIFVVSIYILEMM